MKMSNPNIFALDIGTRKIAGLIIEKQGDAYEILATAVREQLPNAMQDGQIHDIPKVAQVIKTVCQDLSSLTGQQFETAAVAAAGRALLTQHGQATIELQSNQEITALQLRELELDAVNIALEQMAPTKSQTATDSYLCVGYSIVQSFLDDQPIENLVGHRGYSASVEVIATFLPRIVVDSLTSSLILAGLEMESLTLEPIAAIHKVVPASMRMLNLALVDIGAGTSDIAISAAGSIKAYGMVSEAGDLITKVISDQFLLDFMEAERIKRLLSSETSIEYVDVLGNRATIESALILSLIEPAVTQLASKIVDTIKELNAGPPKGVMLIGGGSLTPKIANHIADLLQLPTNLVRIRDRASFTNVKGGDQLTGPQLITPITIGCHHLDDLAMDINKVSVNSKQYQFLRLPDATVGDGLIAAGYSIQELLGLQKQEFTIFLNGEKQIINQHHRGSVELTCNDQPATINTPLRGNDLITVNFSTNESIKSMTLKEVVRHLKITTKNEIQVTINDQTQFIDLPSVIYLDGKKADPSSEIIPGAELEVKSDIMTVQDIIAKLDVAQDITVTINLKPVRLKQGISILVNQLPAATTQQLQPGDQVVLEIRDSNRFILSDIFRFYQADRLKDAKGVKFQVNGVHVGYTHPLADGDQIEIMTKK